MSSRPYKTTWWLVLLVAVLTVPLFYAASMGPACRWASQQTVNRTYWPIITLCDETPLEQPLCQWIQWWHPLPSRGTWYIFHNGEVAWQISQRDGW